MLSRAAQRVFRPPLRMSNQIRGIHPRLVPRAPDPRPSLAMLPALRDVGDDFAWAVWYAVWRVRDGEEPAGPAAAAERLDRFHAAFGTVPELDGALETLADYLRGAGTARGAADALLHISDWALEKGFAEPAIQCAEAASALVPESSRLALASGHANRKSSEEARATIHYERAVTLARHARKWRTYVRAHLGLGKVKKALGDSAGARAHYYTAARAARSLSGEKWLAAQTRHDLMALAAEQGACDEALRHAVAALEWFPRHHASLPALAHDLAFLLVRMDAPVLAVPLLTAAVPKLVPREQVIGWSTLARAAASVGERGAYDEAAEKVLRLVGLFDYHAAAAFANLACGAHRLELWADAEQYALRSLELAEPGTMEREVAQAVLDRVRAKRGADPLTPVMASSSARVPLLIAEVTGRLSVWHGQTWKRKRQSGPERVGRY